MSEQTEEPGPNEIYCTSCGEIINKDDKFCPSCGNKNHVFSNKASSNDISVSGSWWHGVWIGAFLWAIVFLTTPVIPDESYWEGLIGLTAIFAWIILPLAAYFDMKYVEANSNWDPNIPLWVIGFIFWVINILIAFVYLIRRHETMGKP